MSELLLGVVMNEALYTLPLLCRVVADGYGRSCGSIEGPIVSKLELEPRKDDAPLFLNMISLHIERRFPFNRPNCVIDGALRTPLFISMSLHMER